MLLAESRTLRPQASFADRDGHAETEKELGNSAGSSETAANASYHGIYVWQLIANILYHDGLDAVRQTY